VTRKSDATQTLVQLFDAASLRYKTPEDIRTAVWKKYIFISAFATLTSYYDTSIGAIYEKHFDEAKALLKEIANVAHAMNIDIYDEVEKSLETAKNLPYDSSTLMHLDFTNHKATELESLSGTIVSKGLEYSVDVSLMQQFLPRA
jgi:2-dehydropantoate 2-reductase